MQRFSVGLVATGQTGAVLSVLGADVFVGNDGLEVGGTGGFSYAVYAPVPDGGADYSFYGLAHVHGSNIVGADYESEVVYDGAGPLAIFVQDLNAQALRSHVDRELAREIGQRGVASNGLLDLLRRQLEGLPLPLLLSRADLRIARRPRRRSGRILFRIPLLREARSVVWGRIR